MCKKTSEKEKGSAKECDFMVCVCVRNRQRGESEDKSLGLDEATEVEIFPRRRVPEVVRTVY